MQKEIKIQVTRLSIIALLLLFYASFLYTKIDFITDDLGRHITNGRIVLEDRGVLFTNFYSSSNYDFRFINHHWLSGTIFYVLYLAGGFKLIVLFKIVIMSITFLIVFNLSLRRSSFFVVSALSVPFIIILSQRSDARPEMFSYLFIVLFLYILFDFEKGVSKKIFVLPPLQLLWVNIHIFFFMGPFLLLLFFIHSLIRKKRESAVMLLKAGGLMAVVLPINPNFIEGALHPLNILGEYGYEVIENVSPFIVNNHIVSISIKTYIIMLLFFIISFLFALRRQNFVTTTLSLFVVLSSILMLRNLALFALIALPFMCENLSLLTPRKKIVFLSIMLLPLIFVFQKSPTIVRESGAGIKDQSPGAARFFEENKISGNVFNNYDIGGYIIFNHFPGVRPFVDNRPEAYPSYFFKDTYIPMQRDDMKWRAMVEKFDFTSIYFSSGENTDFGRGFIKRRLNDNDWGLVYADRFAMIFVRRDAYPELFERRITVANAEDTLSRLLKSSDMQDVLAAAELSERLGRADIAVKTYEHILSVEPDNVRALFSLASVFSTTRSRGLLEKSAEYYSKAISSGYDIPMIFNLMGKVYFDLNEYEKAKNAWLSALMRNPFDSTAGNYYKQFKKLDRKHNLTGSRGD